MSIGMQAMDHIFPLSHPGVIWLEELCHFGFKLDGYGYIQRVWGVKENPAVFTAVGSSPSVTSPSPGLSHADRLFLLLLGLLSIAHYSSGPSSSFPKAVSTLFYTLSCSYSCQEVKDVQPWCYLALAWDFEVFESFPPSLSSM